MTQATIIKGALGVTLALALSATAAIAQSADKKPRTPVRLLSSTYNPPRVQNMYYFAGLEGYFQKYGLDVTVQQSPGSPASLAAAVGGKAEFASINMITLANAAAEGVKAKAIVIGNFDSPGAILAQPSIKSVKDLEGKTMATSSIGTLEYTVARGYLRAQGVNIDSIKWVATQNSANTVQAMKAGRVDASWIEMPLVVKALEIAPNLKILVDAKQIAEVSPTSAGVVVVTDKYIAEHRDIVQAFVSAVIEANRRMYNDRAFYDKTVNKYIPGVYTEKQLDLLYTAFRASWGVNGGFKIPVLEDGLEHWKTAINPKRAKNPYFSKLDQLIDTSFSAEAIKKLGKVDGALDQADWLKK
jgi:ABC-type nitrate/sulfonate/bicarbonate transport system substrate-binding protein